MRLLALLAAASTLHAAAVQTQNDTAQPAPTAAETASLVRVNATNQHYDFFRPWRKKAPFTRRGLGVVVAPDQILVTAEMIANHTYIELEKPVSAEKSPAEVVVVDYDSNLALLRPLQKDFLAAARPIALDGPAKVGEQIKVLQLESSGQLARTPATITTITVAPYPMDNLALLIYRLSTPLQHRDGSFTIPAVRNGKLTGLLMRYDNRSQSADLIPAPVIAKFLEDVNDGTYVGFPRAGIAFTSTRDPQLRQYIKLTAEGGVYVTEVLANSPAAKAGITKGDVILSVAGRPVDQDGNYDDPVYGKISFSQLTNTASKSGETVAMEIFRDGARKTVDLVLAPVDNSKLASPPYVMDRQPNYVVLGGMVFQELSRPYLEEWGSGWPKEAPQKLVFLNAFQSELPADRGRIVLLSQVLPTPLTVGYEGLQNLVVTRVNGLPIKSLADLAKAAQAPLGGFHTIEFEEDPRVVYLDAEAVEQSNPQLMQAYGIPALQHIGK